MSYGATQESQLREICLPGRSPTPPRSRSCDTINSTWSNGISPVSLNAAITGLKFFFEVTQDRGELTANMQPVRAPQILPVVQSPGEVARLIEAAGNLKNQTALSIANSAGLRASEVVALKVGDIESARPTAALRV